MRMYDDSATRVRAWREILGIPLKGEEEGEGQDGEDSDGKVARKTLLESRACELSAKDTSQVELDVRRGHWVTSTPARSKLARVICGVVASHPGRVHYYQGLHDVAGVLTLMCGDDATPEILERLTLGHLRDCVRGSLEPVLETLKLLPHLIAVADPELHAAIFPPSSAASSSFSDADVAKSNTTNGRRQQREKTQKSTTTVTAGRVDQVTTRSSSSTINDNEEDRPGNDNNACNEIKDDSNDGGDTSQQKSGGGGEHDADVAATRGEVEADREHDDEDDEDEDEGEDGFVMLGVADLSDMEHIAGCHFAVSWLLTWFAHNLKNIDDVSKLFDVFVQSDPLMPLYVGAAAVAADREALLSLARGEGVGGKCRREGATPRDSWPVIEGMLHMRMSALPALCAEEESESELSQENTDEGKTSTKTRVKMALRCVADSYEDDDKKGKKCDDDDARERIIRPLVEVKLEIVASKDDDGDDNDDDDSIESHRAASSGGGGSNDRCAPPSSSSSHPLRRPRSSGLGDDVPNGVSAVIESALRLHARIPPSSLYSIIGVTPEPGGAFDAYPSFYSSSSSSPPVVEKRDHDLGAGNSGGVGGDGGYTMGKQYGGGGIGGTGRGEEETMKTTTKTTTTTMMKTTKMGRDRHHHALAKPSTARDIDDKEEEEEEEEEEDLGRADDGLFPLNNDVESQVSTTTLPNGDRYQGFLSEGRRHGRGRHMFHASTGVGGGGGGEEEGGGIYEGEWRRGVREGVGCHEWKDGSRYAGEWRGGKPDGWGVYTWQNYPRREICGGNDEKRDDSAARVDWRRYKGGFRDGERSGLGVMWRGGGGGSGGGDSGGGGGSPGEGKKKRTVEKDEEGVSVDAGVWKAGALETPMPVTCSGGGTMTATMRAAVREAERAAVRAGDAVRALSSSLRKEKEKEPSSSSTSSSSSSGIGCGGCGGEDQLSSWPWDETVAEPVDDSERIKRDVEAQGDGSVAAAGGGGLGGGRGGGEKIRTGGARGGGDAAEESTRTYRRAAGEETEENTEDARGGGGGRGGGNGGGGGDGDDGGFHFAGLGNGGAGGGGGGLAGGIPLDFDDLRGSATLYVQRLGANIRRGVTKGVRELQTSDQVRGIRGFINKLGGGGGDGGTVPSLRD